MKWGFKMNLLLWITIGFIVAGFIILTSTREGMKERVTLAIENRDSVESKQISTKPVVWWIVGTTVWGLVSILLVVWSFFVYV